MGCIVEGVTDRELRQYVNIAMVKTVLESKREELLRLQEEIEALEVYDKNPHLIDGVSETLLNLKRKNE